MNWAFGLLLTALGATAVTSMIRNQDRPVILEAVPQVPAPAALPGDHPPIEALNRATSLLQASRNDPENADLKVQLGNAYYDAGLFPDAIQAYEQALALKPQGPDVQTDLATSYHYTGRNDKALEILQRVLEQQPGFAPALFNKGVVLLEGMKDSAGAVAAWEELLRLNPTHPQRSELERRMRELRSSPK